MATKSVSIRIEDEMLKKLSYVADYEGRSINSHVLVLIRQSIHEFEAQHGSIEAEIQVITGATNELGFYTLTAKGL